MRFLKLSFLIFLLSFNFLNAQPDWDKIKIVSLAENKKHQAILELGEYLRIPNNGKIEEQVKNNLQWCENALKKRRFTTSVLHAKGVPHLLATREYNKKNPWVLIYMQADGQPVIASEWNQPDPFQPTLKQLNNNRWEIIPWEQINYKNEWRIFARSVSDSKGPGMAFLSALDVLEEAKVKPAFNIKIIIDFQEEAGSPTLPELVRNNKDLFDAKMVLIMDGTRHVTNLPTLTFGARGIATITLRVFGPTEELHSGQYGNFAPNPVFGLSRLLSEMKDENGRVTIPGFYDGIIISEQEKKLINDMPGSDADLMKRIGVAQAEKVGTTYEESLQYPSLNVRGIKAASVGKEVRTIIPSEGIAEIDMRLVPETSGERLITLLKDWIASEGYHFVNDEPTNEERLKYPKLISFKYNLGSKPFRTDLNSPMGIWLDKAMDRTFGPGNYVKQRTTGGSQPIEPFISSLGIPAVSIRIPNPDNNIHSANENLQIKNFVEGIEACIGILTQKIEWN